jgi:competence protein ComEC
MTVSRKRLLKSYLTANFSALTATKQKCCIFNEERILILDSTGTYSKTFILPYSTYAIPKINLDRMLQVLKPQIVVADASNYKTSRNIGKEL